jgi:hypothetical protein
MQRDVNIFLEYNTALLRRITIGNNTIEKVRNCKLLGVILPADLKWIEHVGYISEKHVKDYIHCVTT